MQDQAFQLRNLKLQAAASERTAADQAVSVVSFVGSKGGVGTTSLMIALARYVADRSHTVALTSWSARFADLSALCNIEDDSHASPSASSCACGPGMEVLFTELTSHNGSAEGARLLRSRLTGQTSAQYIFVDLGAELDDARMAFCAASEATILITTADTLAVLDGYASLKRLIQQSGGSPGNIHPVVNQVTDVGAAREAGWRLQATCQRFLGTQLRIPLPVPLGTTRGPHDPVCISYVPAELDVQALAEQINDSIQVPRQAALCAAA